MDSSNVTKAPAGFKLRSTVPPPEAAVQKAPAGFKLRPTQQPAAVPTTEKAPPGFKLRSQPPAETAPVAANGDASVTPTAEAPVLADTGAQDVSITSRVASGAENVAKSLPVIGPANSYYIDLAKAYLSEDTPQHAQAKSAIEAAGKAPDQSSAIGDIQAGYYQNPGILGKQLINGYKLHRAGVNNKYDPAFINAFDEQKKAAAKAIADQAKMPDIPMNPVMAEVTKQNKGADFKTTVQNYGTALATDPLGVMRTAAFRSLPQSWKSIAGGVIGSMAAGEPGAAVGAGFGSYDSEYNSRVIDKITKYGGDIRNEKSIIETLDKFGDKIDKEASKEAAVVGFFDALSGLGAARIAKLPMSGIVGNTAKAGLGGAVDAGFGSAGEAGAQLVTQGKVSAWDDVFQEALGSIAGGAVMESGMAGAEKLSVLRDKLNAGKMPTEAELVSAWQQSIPEEPISSFTEAMNSGRTYYGWISDADNPAQEIQVGSYDQAEKAMGANDVRKGRLIAVSEKDVTESTKNITPEIQAWVDRMVGKVSDNATNKLADQGSAQLVNLLSSKEYTTLSDAIFNIKEKVPPERHEQEINKLLTEMLPKSKVFRGNGFGFRITPRLDNHVLLGSRVFDLDKLQQKAKSFGGFLVPDVSLAQITSMGIIDLADKTFNFASPEIRAQFLEGGYDVRAHFLLNGDVSWKGRADPRFFGRGQYTRTTFTPWYVYDAGLENFSIADMAEAAVDTSTDTFFPSNMQTGGTASPYFFGNSLVDWFTELGIQNNKTEIINLLPSTTPENNWRSAVLKGLTKKFKLNCHVALVHVPVGSLGVPLLHKDFLYKHFSETGVPDQVAEAVIESIFSVFQGGYQAFAQQLSPDLGIIVVQDYGPNVVENKTQEMETLVHEFGHIMSYSVLSSAPLDTLLSIMAAHRRMRRAYDSREDTTDFEARMKTYQNQGKTSNKKQPYRYVSQFEEWWAHQVSRWAFTQGQPMGVIARTAKATARKLIELFKELAPNNTDFRAEPEVEKFLNTLAKREVNAEYSAVLFKKIIDESTKENASAFDDNIDQATPAFENISADMRAILRQTINAGFFSGKEEKQAKKVAKTAIAVVDRFGWIYKWAANLRQVSEANPHIQELQIARELFGQVRIDSAKVHVSADAILQKWRRLGEKRGKALSQLLFNLDQMTYRTADEVEKGVIRWPSKDEFLQMTSELEIDQDTLGVYGEVRDFFLNSVRRLEELRLIDAARIADQALRDAAIKSAKLDSIQLIKKPYFPQTRFGTFSLTVRKLDGKIEAFHLFETAREAKSVAADMLKNEYPSGDFSIVLSTLPEEIAPFVGMSPWMLDKMREMPGLKPEQLDWIDQLRYQMAPSQSFVKHMMRRKNIIGASHDGRRVFANYAFHHGRNYARTKYGSAFRDIIASLRKSLPAGYEAPELSKRNAMADMVQHQVNELMNPSRDWAHLRAINAIWHLGFNVKSAVVNSTQIFVTTAFLGAKFGGIKAEAAMLAASAKLSSYYRKGSLAHLGQTEAEFKALDRAVKDGHIDESMAAELAAVAIGGGVGQRMGKSLFGDKFITGYINFTEKAMWLQRMTDQWQRRLTFRAAWKLAMDNPNNKWLQSLRLKHAMQFETLMRENWSDREALAYLAGMDASVQTQGTYDRQARPRYMQGRKSVLFAFQLFSQQNLWMLANNKDMWLRYSLYMLALGGMTGLIPDDLENVFEGVGKMAFGKDFNWKRGAREFITNLFGDKIPPDLILQGAARYGFGFHQAADMLGMPFIPEVDLSQSMGIGRLVPLDAEKLGQPGLKAGDILSAGTENVAGAAYGVPISVLKAVMADEYALDDFKRWEGALPAAMRNSMRAWRLYTEGGDRTKSGAMPMSFDGDDPEQLGEIIGQALGFRPTRITQQYDRQAAERELDQFWSTKKEMLMRQAYRDRFIYKDEEAYKETLKQIREYNQRAIAPKYKITGDSLMTSFKRRKSATQKLETGASTPAQVRSMVDKLYPETVSEQPARIK